MRRDINGKVDGKSIKMGDTTTTIAGTIAPIVIGKVFANYKLQAKIYVCSIILTEHAFLFKTIFICCRYCQELLNSSIPWH